MLNLPLPSLMPEIARRPDDLPGGLSNCVGRTIRANGMLHGDMDHDVARRLASGWMGVVRFLVDGRRQVIHILLPGDLLGTNALMTDPAQSAAVALTRAMVALAGPVGEQERQEHTRRMIWCMQNQICRIGRQSAYERIANLFAELLDRLTIIGQAHGDTFDMPLTQDVLGDTLGLTSVHVNRTLQQMRRDGLIRLSGRTVTLLDRPAVERIGEYRPLPRD